MYKERYLLELNWKNDKFTQYRLYAHSKLKNCVKIFKNWILTSSDDCTIKIWDNETYRCLKVLGERNLDILKQLGVLNLERLKNYSFRRHLMEVTKDINLKFHLSPVGCMDINDKYLVSGSSDGYCIIWQLPDFDQ